MKDKNRRRLLVSGGQGVALLSTGQWTKPVVQHVVLPVHAATTESADSPVIVTTTFDPADFLRDVVIPLVLSKSPHK